MKNLDEKKWIDFELSKIAQVDSGHDIYAQERIEGNVPYITSGTSNNGIGYFVGNNNNSKAQNAISVNRNGAVGEAFYHPYPALYGNDCRRVALNESKSAEMQLFVAHMISKQKSAFSYCRKLGTVRLKRLHLMLPTTEEGTPDYAYMSEYIQNTANNLKNTYRTYAKKQIVSLGDTVTLDELSKKVWKGFLISDIFNILPGKRLVAANSTLGNRPFIGALDNSNGVARFVSDTNASLDKNVLGVNYNGNGMVIGFYHPYECIFSDDVKRFHLKHHEDNAFVLLFMKVAILQQKSKFGYLYKFNSERMANTRIMLPVDDDGSPDYSYMEQYTKNMMLRKYKQYLTYLDSKETPDAVAAND
jgi:hypothetical protein